MWFEVEPWAVTKVTNSSTLPLRCNHYEYVCICGFTSVNLTYFQILCVQDPMCCHIGFLVPSLSGNSVSTNIPINKAIKSLFLPSSNCI